MCLIWDNLENVPSYFLVFSNFKSFNCMFQLYLFSLFFEIERLHLASGGCTVEQFELFLF